MDQDKKFLELFLKNWHRIKEPIRASEQENAFYEAVVARASDKKNPTMLILGATPEFRDMGIRHGMKPVSCDLAPPVFEAMKRFMKESGEEEFIHSDWLDLPDDRSYDLIIGDGPLNMLSKEAGRPFFEKLAALLKDDGRVVQRIMTIDRRFTITDFEAAAREHREERIPMLLWSYSLMMINTIRQLHHPELTTEELFEQKLVPLLPAGQVEELRPLMFGGKIYLPLKEDLSDMWKGRFDVEEIRWQDGPGYWGMSAQYLFRKARRS